MYTTAYCLGDGKILILNKFEFEYYLDLLLL